MIFLDFIAELGLTAVKDKILESAQQKQVKEQIRLFLERQASYNELVSRKEELDFEGLSEYICNQLLQDVKIRLFGRYRERRAARQSIEAKAIAYAKAVSPESEERVTILVLKAVDILRDFYRSKANRELQFICAEIVDSIEEINANQHKEQASDIANTIIEKLEAQSLLSIDQSLKSLSEGDISKVETTLSMHNRGLSSGHALFPDYGYKIESNGINVVLRSHPLNEEALKKYPPKIKFSATANIRDQKVADLSAATIDYAYRHQSPIVINFVDAKKFLGDILDPVQHEAEDWIGKKMVLNPRPFPEAFPCSLSIGGEVIFDYVLLRTIEIMDDGTVVVANNEQKSSALKLILKLNQVEQTVKFSLSINNGSNVEFLKYSQFNKLTSQGGEISCRILSTGEDIFRAMLDPFECESTFNNIDEDIEFYENILAIEEHFGKHIEILSEYRESDLFAIKYAGGLLRGQKHHDTWESIEAVNLVTDEFKQKLVESYSSIGPVVYIGSVDLTIFNEPFHLGITRSFSSVAIKNLPELIEKVSTMNIGEPVDLLFIPDNEEGLGTCEDAIYYGNPQLETR